MNKSELKSKKPILVGIIVDVSSSMQRNWRNRDGKNLPRIELIRDSLNSQLRKLAFLSDKQLTKKIKLFCLGAGFKRTVSLTSLDLNMGYEREIAHPPTKHVFADQICDLLALSEMIPAKYELNNLITQLNRKWLGYVTEFSRSADALQNEDTYNLLQKHIAGTLKVKALRRFKRGFLYWRLRSLNLVQRVIKHPQLASLNQSTLNEITRHETWIAQKTSSTAEQFLKNIMSKSQDIFNANKSTYQEYLSETLKLFATEQARNIVDLMSLGYPIGRVLQSFDEPKVRTLGREILSHLEKEVRGNIQVVWVAQNVWLFAEAARLGVNVDHNTVKILTERCIQNYSWEILSPFVEGIVTNLFQNAFEKIGRERVDYWLQIAASREVTRSLQEITHLLPEIATNEFYSSEHMFGSTPMYETIYRATLRLCEKQFRNYTKYLVIISDGEFDGAGCITLTSHLKQRNVTIICCQVKDRNILAGMTDKIDKRSSPSVRTMFEMASTVSEQTILTTDLSLPSGAKLYYQINHAELLNDLLAGLVAVK